MFRYMVWLLIASASIGYASPGGQHDKREWSVVTCSGFKGWEACKAHALRACPKGFDVANQQENQVTQERSMEYACKP